MEDVRIGDDVIILSYDGVSLFEKVTDISDTMVTLGCVSYHRNYLNDGDFKFLVAPLNDDDGLSGLLLACAKKTWFKQDNLALVADYLGVSLESIYPGFIAAKDKLASGGDWVV